MCKGAEIGKDFSFYLRTSVFSDFGTACGAVFESLREKSGRAVGFKAGSGWIFFLHKEKRLLGTEKSGLKD